MFDYIFKEAQTSLLCVNRIYRILRFPVKETKPLKKLFKNT